MAVRQIKILQKNNDNIPFRSTKLNFDLIKYVKNYEENLISSGKVIKESYIEVGKNKLIIETIYKDIESFFTTCNDLSKDEKLDLYRLENAKYRAENNIIETQTRDFNYNLES